MENIDPKFLQLVIPVVIIGLLIVLNYAGNAADKLKTTRYMVEADKSLLSLGYEALGDSDTGKDYTAVYSRGDTSIIFVKQKALQAWIGIKNGVPVAVASELYEVAETIERVK